MALAFNRRALAPVTPGPADIRAAFARTATVQEDFRKLAHITREEAAFLALAAVNLQEVKKAIADALDANDLEAAKRHMRRAEARTGEAIANVEASMGRKSVFAQACDNFADLVDKLHAKLRKVLCD